MISALKHKFGKWQHLLLYSASLAALVFILKWLEWKLLIINNSMNIFIGLIAVFFTALGVWMATQIANYKVKTVVVEKPVYVDDNTINQPELDKLNLSSREYDVLQLLVKGHSNADIAEGLFLSVSTVKTHVSNLFVKMDVKSRAQAIEKAKRLRITA